eukprot:scaffold2028_cov181-Ochromonas_danica.AAC.17
MSKSVLVEKKVVLVVLVLNELRLLVLLPSHCVQQHKQFQRKEQYSTVLSKGLMTTSAISQDTEDHTLAHVKMKNTHKSERERETLCVLWWCLSDTAEMRVVTLHCGVCHHHHHHHRHLLSLPCSAL